MWNGGGMKFLYLKFKTEKFAKVFYYLEGKFTFLTGLKN